MCLQSCDEMRFWKLLVLSQGASEGLPVEVGLLERGSPRTPPPLRGVEFAASPTGRTCRSW